MPMRRISSSRTWRNRSSTTSSEEITASARPRSLRTKESTLSVTILMVARAMSPIGTRSLMLLSAISRVISAMSAAWSPMRSMSEIIFRAEEMVRRSRATGCCWSSSFIHRLSMSRSFWLMSRSAASTVSRRPESPSSRALAAPEMTSSHRAPMVISSTLSRSSCASNLTRIIQTSR